MADNPTAGNGDDYRIDVVVGDGALVALAAGVLWFYWTSATTYY